MSVRALASYVLIGRNRCDGRELLASAGCQVETAGCYECKAWPSGGEFDGMIGRQDVLEGNGKAQALASPADWVAAR
jgi:hypothetical protein